MSSYGQMPEKSPAWLEAECLKRCRHLMSCRHLEAVKIEPTKPTGSGRNWQVAAFKPELDEIAHQEAGGSLKPESASVVYSPHDLRLLNNITQPLHRTAPSCASR